MKLKVNFFNQIKALSVLIILTCLYTVFIFFCKQSIDFELLVIWSLTFATIFVVPVIIIHLNYYMTSLNVDYVINENNLIVIKGNKKFTYTNTDLTEIVFYMTANKSKDSGLSNFPFEDYYYCKIKFINKEETIITCLHSNKIDKLLADNFKEIKIVKVKTFYPFIS